MSSMLEQAIVDASALKEAAIKNAEQAIIEKYSHQIKDAIETILEQDEELATDEPAAESEFVQQAPLAATEGEDLCPCPEEDEEVEIDFDQLAKEIEAAEEMDAGELVDREGFAEEELEGLEENVDIDESLLLDMLEETFEIDKENLEEIIPQPSLKRDDEEKEELDEEELEERTKTSDAATGKEPGRKVKNIATGQAVTEKLHNLQESLGKILKENKKYKNIILKFKEKFDEMNLSNAKLLYSNRILDSASLNERQKRKLVEAISKSDSVEEAKTIYDTLQSAVGSISKKNAPKSLNEAIGKRSSTIIHSAERKQVDPLAERMKKLAGIG